MVRIRYVSRKGRGKDTGTFMKNQGSHVLCFKPLLAPRQTISLQLGMDTSFNTKNFHILTNLPFLDYPSSFQCSSPSSPVGLQMLWYLPNQRPFFKLGDAGVVGGFNFSPGIGLSRHSPNMWPCLPPRSQNPDHIIFIISLLFRGYCVSVISMPLGSEKGCTCLRCHWCHWLCWPRKFQSWKCGKVFKFCLWHQEGNSNIILQPLNILTDQCWGLPLGVIRTEVGFVCLQSTPTKLTAM